MTLTDLDLHHLRRCVELAREALDDGDEPFGSLLVSASGEVLVEDRNRVKDGDHTRHPELAIAQWAARNLTVEERAAAMVYTSGEHCPMCAAAHGWVGLGRIVAAVRSAQLASWMQEWGEPAPAVASLPVEQVAPAPAVASLPVEQVAPAVVVDGPATELVEEMEQLHRARVERDRARR